MRSSSGGRAGPVIAVHGGAWAIPADLTAASVDGCRGAADAGWRALDGGGSAVDAVEAAVRALELDPVFDAGRGSVLTSAGTVELDAVIMDGASLDAGAVAALGPCLHPITVARRVMDASDHVLLVGAGADAFARERGIPAAAPEDLVTDAAREEWAAMAAFPAAVGELFNRGHDTVGAVAMDAGGNVAAATSTGGITFKRPGRVGDSPIVGAGALADNDLGAISTTGHGESILRFTLASRVLSAVGAGASPDAALRDALAAMRARTGGCGGAVCLDARGRVGVAFSTDRMAWATRDGAGARAGIDRDVDAETDAEDNGVWFSAPLGPKLT